jgi:hypothetical protein
MKPKGLVVVDLEILRKVQIGVKAESFDVW